MPNMVKCEGVSKSATSERPLEAPSHVKAHLGDVVRDVIDNMHIQVVSLLLKHLLEGLPHKEGHGGAIDPCIVGRT